MDTAYPDYPLIVSVLNEAGEEVAWGVAHLYRHDLAEAGKGTGWCGFRLRGTADLGNSALTLIDRQSRAEIGRSDLPPVRDDEPDEIISVAALIACDPTVVASVAQLWRCGMLFDMFIASHGVDAFVRTAHAYILARPPDDDVLSLYCRRLEERSITPFSVLQTLSDSDEFKCRASRPGVPNMLAFPFVAARDV